MARLQIDPASWTALNQLLDEALDRPVADRSAWIDALDEQFAQLKPRLRELLARAASVETGDFLGTMPKFGVGAAEAEATRAPGVTAGEMLGVYRLVRELGAGGMGSVWLAERADGLFQRPVALKLPHVIASRDAALAERMAREREILATLDHRNIAKLLDAGITADGQPFMALEFVEGVPIDQFCAGAAGAASADIGQRLRLFRQVAEAVAYAHGKLIVHRDLKPANILVTAGGGVKLLDFGIAKLLDQGTAAETRLTQAAGRALTPDYASPEQILGEPLTVASDVYSLGVVLFELLTGARPYRLKRDSRGALEDAIVQAESARASQVAAPQFRKRLRGDLDTIVAKALKKNPHERYVTVNALVDDITRYLEQRPVLARPDSRLYRLRKFVVRNSLAVGAATAVSAAVVVGIGLALVQARETRAEQARTQAVKSTMIAMFKNAEPYASGGKQLTAAELLRHAFAEQQANPLEDPGALAELYNVLGASLVALEDIETAERVAEVAVAHARRHFPEGDPLVLEARLVRASVLRFRDGASEFQREIDTLLPLLRSHESDQPAQLIDGLLLLAHQQIDSGRHDVAVAAAQEAKRLAEKNSGAGGRAAIEALATASVAYSFARRDEAALEAARDAHARASAFFAGEPGHPLVIETRAVLGRALGASRQYRAAIEQYEAALIAAREIWGERSVSAGSYLHSLSKLRLLVGDVRRAIDESATASEISEAVGGNQSREYTLRRAVEVRALLAGRRAIQAAATAKPMIPLEIQYFGSDDAGAIETQAAYALAIAELGDCTAANSAARGLPGAAPQGAAVSLSRLRLYLGRTFRLCGDTATATYHLEHALVAARKAEIPSELAAVHAELGMTALAIGELARADEEFANAGALLDNAGHTATPTRADVWMGNAQLEFERQQSEIAVADAKRAEAFWREFDPANPYAARSAQLLKNARAVVKSR